MKRFWNAERVACAVALAVASGAWHAASRFPGSGGAPSGPATFPLFLSAALAALSLLGLTRPSALGRTPDENEARLDLPRLIVLAAAAAAYLVALPRVGFITSTALFGAATLMFLGVRRPARALAAGFLFAFALYGLFDRLMNVALPKGWLG